MASLNWGASLNAVTPITGGGGFLDPGTYNFKVLSGAGKVASTGKHMISVQLEVLDGPKQGRKIWHNWVLPNEDNDKAAISLGYFLGDMECFGLTKEWFVENLGQHEISEQTTGYIGTLLVGKVCTADVTIQKSDSSRNNIGKFRPVEPTAGLAAAPAAAAPPAPGVPGVPGVPPATPIVPPVLGGGAPIPPAAAPAAPAFTPPGVPAVPGVPPVPAAAPAAAPAAPAPVGFTPPPPPAAPAGLQF